MKRFLEFVLQSRAAGLARPLLPHLPPSGRVLDLGSGTGHTVQALRRYTSLSFVEADVVNMSVVGAGPVLFGDDQLPFAAGTFASAILSFVLQYPVDPGCLLREVRRVAAGRVLVWHATPVCGSGQIALRLNEFVWGPVAFAVARAVRLVGDCHFSLSPKHFFNRHDLRRLFRACGFDSRLACSHRWPGAPVRHDLFVLEPCHA